MYVAARLDGTRSTYVSAAALNRAKRRANGHRVIVDSWPANDPPPFGSSDARAWDDYRARRGYAGGRS